MSKNINIPFEKQEETSLNRMCGAAALVMVYRSFGLTVTQPEVWSNISSFDSHGGRYARTSVLCQDALRRGLKSIIVKAKDPLSVLQICSVNSLRAIMNHRLRSRSSLGHFTVLVDITSKSVVYHDPQYGPYRRIANKNLLNLWLPKTNYCEIGGNILIAITNKHLSKYACPSCSTVIPQSIRCFNPMCGKSIPLQPGNILGCVNYYCPERTWQLIFCPYCESWISP